MPLTLLAVLVAVALSLLRGGRLRRLADAPIRATGLLVGGLALQVGVDVTTAQGLVGGAVSAAVLVLSQVLVVGWVVANRYRAGMPLILLGLLMNLVVIAANGAMPVDLEAVNAAGGATPVVALGKHEPLTEASRLAFLADIFAIPLLRTVVSAGDVVLAAGLIPLAHDLMTYRPRHVRRGGHRRQDPTGSVANDPPETDQVL
ncbi:MAG: DUF5317 domain-containing protein [Actinobacteria bacterium]|nr:DUF5317 domain-containing protein [Actinomycetota bacterium]